MTLKAVIKTRVGDPLSVGRDCWIVVRALAIGEGAEGAVGNTELVNFGVEILVVGFRMTIGGDEEKFSVRRPGRASGAVFVAAIGEISVGDLAWCAAFRGDNKNLHEAWFQVACAVESIDEAIVGRGWLGPLSSRGRRRQISEVRTFAEN